MKLQNVRGTHLFLLECQLSLTLIERLIYFKQKCSFELMHCVSTYPKVEDANLLTINALRKNRNVMLVIVVMKMELQFLSSF